MLIVSHNKPATVTVMTTHPENPIEIIFEFLAVRARLQGVARDVVITHRSPQCQRLTHVSVTAGLRCDRRTQYFSAVIDAVDQFNAQVFVV